MLTKRSAILFGGLFMALAAVAVIAITFVPDAGHIAALASFHDGHSVLAFTPLAALRATRLDLHNKMKAIIEAAETANRELTAEEAGEFDRLKAEKDGLDQRISRAEEVAATETALNAVVPAHSRGAAPGVVRAGGPEASREFESMGEFLHAVRFRPSDQRLEFVEGVGAQVDESGLQAEMRMDNDTSGGFMVPTQLRQNIMSVAPQDSLVRPRAQVIPAGSPPDAAITMPALDQAGTDPGHMFGGMTFSWIEEGGEKPETDANLRAVTLTPHEIAGFVTVTDKLLRNWQASAAFVESLMRGGVNAAEDYAFLRGNGLTQPLGALNAPAMKFINRTTSNSVTYADLLEMVARLLMRGGTPVWSMPQGALPKIATITDPEGHYIWKANAVDGFAGTLLGYPVRWNNRSPQLGSKGDISLIDWSYYLIKDGSGPFVAASEHVKFTSNKTVIKIFWNVDGAPWLHAPIAEENGYEVSPLVGLDVPG